MFTAVGIIFLVVIVLLVPSIIMLTGKLKKGLIIFNAVLFSAILIAAIVNSVDDNKTAKDRRTYEIEEGAILSDITYTGNIDGYAMYVESGLVYSTSYAVPLENVEISPLCNHISSVKLYYPLGSKHVDVYEDERVMIGDHYYYIDPYVVKIVPSFWSLMFTIILLNGIGLGIVDFIMLIVAIVIYVKKKKIKKNSEKNLEFSDESANS